MNLDGSCASCGHKIWSHDLGGDSRSCRFDNCSLNPGAGWDRRLPARTPSQFTKKPITCGGCPLHGDGLGFARTYGKGEQQVFILAESLGEEEERESRPLVGKTGQFTSRMIARTIDPLSNLPLDLDRDFIRGNLVSCKPFMNQLGGPSAAAAIGHCRQYWTEDVAKARPKVIYALGDHAVRALTGMSGITAIRGCTFDTEYGPVVAGLHPAYLLRGKLALTTYWRMDLLRALYVARHGLPKRDVHYTLYPTGAEMALFYEEWVQADRPMMAFDIETPHSSAMKDEDPLGGEEDPSDIPIEEDPSYTILRISFSYKPGTAITMPWVEPFISWSKRIIETATTLCGWNSESFDLPRLAAAGIHPTGDHVDLMNLWHLLEPALPMGLKQTANTFIPGLAPAWVSKKLAQDEPTLYSAKDGDVTITLGEMLVARAKREGKWPIFQRQFVELGKVLRKMTKRGIRVDQEIRRAGREEFETQLAERAASLQPLVPIAIRPKKVYAGDEEALKRPRRRKGEVLPPIWQEGRMVQVTIMAPPPKARKLEWIVTYLKELKSGPKEKRKTIKAFTAEEALTLVPRAIRAEAKGAEKVGGGDKEVHLGATLGA